MVSPAIAAARTPTPGSSAVAGVADGGESREVGGRREGGTCWQERQALAPGTTSGPTCSSSGCCSTGRWSTPWCSQGRCAAGSCVLDSRPRWPRSPEGARTPGADGLGGQAGWSANRAAPRHTHRPILGAGRRCAARGPRDPREGQHRPRRHGSVPVALRRSLVPCHPPAAMSSIECTEGPGSAPDRGQSVTAGRASRRHPQADSHA